jgi:hypothetical protein
MKVGSSTRQRGVSLVEFVIVFPVAVLFVLSLIQAGFMFMAKLTLNHATFMAARAGSLNNARTDVIRNTLIRGLSPFYQDSSIGDDVPRLARAWAEAQVDARQPWNLDVAMLNPSPQAFTDFGVRDPRSGVTYIPNDNIEWRATGVRANSRMNIQDANLLKLRVVYAYELKVPLVRNVLRWTMCGGNSGVSGWGNVGFLEAIAPTSTQCLQYYARGRVPIESFAIVEMQSRAERP